MSWGEVLDIQTLVTNLTVIVFPMTTPELVLRVVRVLFLFKLVAVLNELGGGTWYTNTSDKLDCHSISHDHPWTCLTCRKGTFPVQTCGSFEWAGGGTWYTNTSDKLDCHSISHDHPWTCLTCRKGSFPVQTCGSFEWAGGGTWYTDTSDRYDCHKCISHYHLWTCLTCRKGSFPVQTCGSRSVESAGKGTWYTDMYYCQKRTSHHHLWTCLTCRKGSFPVQTCGSRSVESAGKGTWYTDMYYCQKRTSHHHLWTCLTCRKCRFPVQTCGRNPASAGRHRPEPDRTGLCPCSAGMTPRCPTSCRGQSSDQNTIAEQEVQKSLRKTALRRRTFFQALDIA